MAIKILKAETVSAMSETAVDLKAAFDGGAKIIPINNEPNMDDPSDSAWVKRIEQWEAVKAQAELDRDAATDPADKAAYTKMAIAATQNLEINKLGFFGRGYDSYGRVKIIDGSFIDKVYKALNELNALPETKASPNAYYIVRKGEEPLNQKVTVTFGAKRERPRGEKLTNDGYGASLDAKLAVTLDNAAN